MMLSKRARIFNHRVDVKHGVIGGTRISVAPRLPPDLSFLGKTSLRSPHGQSRETRRRFLKTVFYLVRILLNWGPHRTAMDNPDIVKKRLF